MLKENVGQKRHCEIPIRLNGNGATATSVPHRDSFLPFYGVLAKTRPQTGLLDAELGATKTLSTSFLSEEMARRGQTLTPVSQDVRFLSLITSGILPPGLLYQPRPLRLTGM